MGRLSFGLDSLCLFSGSSSSGSCFCSNGFDSPDDFEKKPFIGPKVGQVVKLKDVVAEPTTLAFHLKPKTVVLRVSMHCKSCAKKVEKHISKMEGVTSYEIDMETKMVVVIGDVVPFEVLESVSKVKNASFGPLLLTLLNSSHLFSCLYIEVYFVNFKWQYDVKKSRKLTACV
ncbi:PREDICTED: heavy metal-associated isoprenylated plant protein 7-like [Ipomoea nil]|uniref:heavy metal-associated isoprenylated plant protein 7-like n=1 Tax=Ipomoea nil TaxID=35883 RepID=UPI000901D9AE|nr:PREDICTED: heavy metal-associated isoprenylated plant protein 7-like [Ipomoea nil]